MAEGKGEKEIRRPFFRFLSVGIKRRRFCTASTRLWRPGCVCIIFGLKGAQVYCTFSYPISWRCQWSSSILFEEENWKTHLTFSLIVHLSQTSIISISSGAPQSCCSLSFSRQFPHLSLWKLRSSVF